jgi:TolA-binding protein
MTTKSALLRSAAVGLLFAAGLSANAQAAARRPAPKETGANEALMAQIQQLSAQVQALQARLDAQERAQQATQAQVSQTQTQVAQVVSDSESVQQRLEDVPTQVLATVAELPKPKPSWADSTSVTGRMYFNLSSISQKANGLKTPPSGVGFDLKRFYLGVDHRFNDTYSANLTTDVQYSSAISSTHLYIKKAYLQAHYSDALNVRLGAADLPWVPFAEDLYGYRHIEPVVSDRTRFATSAEWGVHAFGRLGPYVSYAVAVVDGSGYRAPLRSNTMDVEGRVSAKVKDFTVAVGGYTGKLGRNIEGATNVFHTASRINALAAYTHGPIRAGVEYFHAKNWSNVTTAASDESDGYSVFGSYAFTPRISLFGRYDWVKPRKTTASALDENYFNVGVQYEPVRIVDVALVYKHDKIENGTFSTTNGVIGGSINGTYNEVGLFGQLRW